jgi:hypothetical protein
MVQPFTVMALIAAYNEEDIIEPCLEHLHEQGIACYLIDDGSTDQTVERAKTFLGRGLIGLERLPPADAPTFSLSRILSRKEALAEALDDSWFINHDADEFRDSLWAELDLRSAIERVDALGWNAIDFEIFTIRPTGDRETARVSPNDAQAWFSPAAQCDRVQVRAWKRTLAPVDLISSGGHDVAFEGRRVFPLRFPLRHYPIRSQAHGERKLFQDRIPRFDPSERGRGWHLQYGAVQAGDTLVAAPVEVEPYDATNARIRSALNNRDLEAVTARLSGLEPSTATLLAEIQELRHRAHQTEKQFRDHIATLERDGARFAAENALFTAEAHQLGAEIHALRHSLSWRWTAPLRACVRFLRSW